ncbi:MAG: ribosomal-processing cysteine protease Prp [Spirochaetaceae bacterium]|jgi:uncharacterized protein YsxB (DUF464 family)|nr:ribosomal-processing cysteine protease Prp [Spirochaetaceae bacterium]
MTEVALSRTEQGFTCRAEGHAGFAPAGSDIVCAAVTVLLRTAAEMLEATPGVAVRPLAVQAGALSFQVERRERGESGRARDDGPDALGARLWAVGDFIKTGMESLQREFPGHISFREEPGRSGVSGA